MSGEGMGSGERRAKASSSGERKARASGSGERRVERSSSRLTAYAAKKEGLSAQAIVNIASVVLGLLLLGGIIWFFAGSGESPAEPETPVAESPKKPNQAPPKPVAPKVEPAPETPEPTVIEPEPSPILDPEPKPEPEPEPVAPPKPVEAPKPAAKPLDKPTVSAVEKQKLRARAALDAFLAVKKDELEFDLRQLRAAGHGPEVIKDAKERSLAFLSKSMAPIERALLEYAPSRGMEHVPDSGILEYVSQTWILWDSEPQFFEAGWDSVAKFWAPLE